MYMYSSIIHVDYPQNMLPRLRKDKELSSSVVTMSTYSEHMMIASKPGYQLHAQFIPFKSFADNGR